MDVGIEEAVPVFPALLGRAKNFIPGGVSFIEQLRDQFPVRATLFCNCLGQ
jgi:hypothetical protein